MQNPPAAKPVLGIVLLITMSVPCLAQTAAHKLTLPDANARIPGAWRGTSVCMAKDSPCQDEVNVYRFSAIEGRPDWYSCAASKLVEGREVEMGSTEWKYDRRKHVLESDSPAGQFRLVLRGDMLEGGILRRDPVTHAPIPCDPFPCSGNDSDLYYRRIHLTKVH